MAPAECPRIFSWLRARRPAWMFAPMRVLLLALCSLALLLSLAACESPGESGRKAFLLTQRQAILSEPKGDYFIGRRYYNSNYKFWGYVRRPGEPWHDAKLVMFDENEKLAPDREINQFGVDNNVEYKLYGYFTGKTVYEPASNGFYPEFHLKGYEIRDRNPPSIFPPGTRLPDDAINHPD